MTELEEYRSIGTVDEFRKLKYEKKKRALIETVLELMEEFTPPETKTKSGK